MSTLLLGMGNPILSDDAVGVRLAADFARRLRDVPDLVVIPECSVGGLALLDVFQGYDRAIILDSVQATPASPGRWHRFDARALRESQHLTNIHDANFATALELGRRLGIPLPDDSAIHIFAVEVADAVTFSDRMTAPLEAGYPIYSQQIFAEILRLLVASVRGPAPHGAPTAERLRLSSRIKGTSSNRNPKPGSRPTATTARTPRDTLPTCSSVQAAG